MLGNFTIRIILSLILFASACGRGTTEKTALEYMPNMADSPALKAQEVKMREPVLGSRPIGYNPYPYLKDEGDLAGMALANPITVNMKALKAGKKSYDTFCIVCHGPTGKGDGLIVPKFPMPPSLHSEKLRNWTDGRIFHVVTKGQNLMPSYASQVPESERWALVHYVRALQRSVYPTDEDVRIYQKALDGGQNP